MFTKPVRTSEFKAPTFGAFGSKNFAAAFHEGDFYILFNHRLYRVGESQKSWALPFVDPGNCVGYNWEFTAGLPRALLLVYCHVLIHFSIRRGTFTVFEGRISKNEEYPRRVRWLATGGFEWFGKANHTSYDDVLDEYSYTYRASVSGRRWKSVWMGLPFLGKEQPPLLNTAANFWGFRPEERAESQPVDPQWVGTVEGRRISEYLALECPVCSDPPQETRMARLGRRFIGVERFPSRMVKAYLWEVPEG